MHSRSPPPTPDGLLHPPNSYHTHPPTHLQTASGIFLPSAADKTQSEATVIAVGPGAKDKDGKVIEMSLKAGDRVLLPGYGGQNIKVGEEEYTIFRDSEILAKLNE